jgi:hypothetical protein
VLRKNVPAGGQVAKADGVATIGIARRRRATARRGRADMRALLNIGRLPSPGR